MVRRCGGVWREMNKHYFVGVGAHDDPFNRFKTYIPLTCHSERRKCHGVTFSKSNPTIGRAMRSIGISERFRITRLKSNIMLSKVHQALCRSLRRSAACFPLGSFFASREVRLRPPDTEGVILSGAKRNRTEAKRRRVSGISGGLRSG